MSSKRESFPQGLIGGDSFGSKFGSFSTFLLNIHHPQANGFAGALLLGTAPGSFRC